MLHKRANAMAMQDPMSSSFFSGVSHTLEHIVRPVSCRAQITRNCSPNPLRISDGPRVAVRVTVEDVPIVLSEQQFGALLELTEAFRMRFRAEKYYRWRPKSSVAKK